MEKKAPMRRMLLGFALILCGLAALSMAAVGPATARVAAGPALQPSPRPTLVPTPDLRGDDYDYADPAPMGRITGTVIDLRTGAPVAGKRVKVGDAELTTDGNGNYDTWVEAGQYPVALSIASAEGTAAQDVTTATVWGNDTVVIHLFYTSLVPAPAAPAATAVPAAPSPVLALPDELPVTSVAPQPAALPVTGDEQLDPTGVVLGGLALLALGATLMLMPRRAPARVPAGASRALRRRKSAEEVLRELLRRDP
jgi:hypothetical protein